MGEKVSVWVEASDPITSFGINAQLSESTELVLVDRQAVDSDTVVILAVDRIDDRIRQRTAELRGRGCTRYILIAAELDDDQLLAAVNIGVCAVIKRRDTTPVKLERLVLRAVQGESELPTALLVRLFREVSDRDRVAAVTSRTLPFAGLTTRESQILRLVADGLDTDEIARQLSYSSRTVKNVLHAVTTRFCLRNRSHAVAYAMREGLI